MIACQLRDRSADGEPIVIEKFVKNKAEISKQVP